MQNERRENAYLMPLQKHLLTLLKIAKGENIS
jgi:hypothetical protein